MMESQELQSIVCDVVRRVLANEGRAVEVHPAQDFRRELNVDSIALLNLIFTLEERLGVDLFQYSQRLAGATRVADLIAVAQDAMLGRTDVSQDVQ